METFHMCRGHKREETPLVSIVLPVYNCAKYLSSSIESCIAQTYTHWELIIVDDCSTDSTPDIIKSYVESDSRIRSVRNSHNLKLPASLNIGFGLAEGDYLAWVAADDCYRPQTFEQVIGFLESNAEIDLVYTDFSITDDRGNPTSRIIVKEPESLAVLNGAGPCRFYRRAVQDKLGGYDESLFLVEDYDFLLRAFCLFRLQAIHEDLYLFRIHENGLTTTHATKIPDAKHLAKEKNLPLLKSKSPVLAAKCHLSLIDPALVDGKVRRARSHAFKALLCSPVYVVRQGRSLIIAAMVGPTLHRMVRSVIRNLLLKAS